MWVVDMGWDGGGLCTQKPKLYCRPKNCIVVLVGTSCFQ